LVQAFLISLILYPILDIIYLKVLESIAVLEFIRFWIDWIKKSVCCSIKSFFLAFFLASNYSSVSPSNWVFLFSYSSSVSPVCFSQIGIVNSSSAL
jgi:hypothetical protein